MPCSMTSRWRSRRTELPSGVRDEIWFVANATASSLPIDLRRSWPFRKSDDRRAPVGQHGGMSRRAVCVGINEYPKPQMALRGCVNDAHGWAELLAGHFDFARDDIAS